VRNCDIHVILRRHISVQAVEYVRLLYQLAGSRYCEKVRWALDYKSLPYRAVNLISGSYMRTSRKIAGETSVPILVDADKIVHGSAEIILYLDKSKRHPPLTPMDSQDASTAYEWERYLDRNLGVALRLYFYHYALRDRAFASDFFVRGNSLVGAAALSSGVSASASPNAPAYGH
jgi:glutathione S-transferase